MTDETNKSDSEIDAELAAFFKAAASDASGAAAPSDALIAAVLADAYRLQPASAGPVRPAPRRRFEGLSDVWRGLGGWRAATAFGLFLALGGWLGYTPPSGLEPVADRFSGQVIETVGATSDYFPLDDLMSEG